jgi:hypothetical protein
MHADRLAELDYQIGEIETFVERQRQVIADWKAIGRSTTDAEATLDRFLRALAVVKRRRQTIQDA